MYESIVPNVFKKVTNFVKIFSLKFECKWKFWDENLPDEFLEESKSSFIGEGEIVASMGVERPGGGVGAFSADSRLNLSLVAGVDGYVGDLQFLVKASAWLCK